MSTVRLSNAVVEVLLDALGPDDLGELARLRRELPIVPPASAVALANELAEMSAKGERPAIGLYRRHGVAPAPCSDPVGQWLSGEGSGLRAVVVEMRRFTSDEIRVATAAVDLGERVGMSDAVIELEVAAGLRLARRRQAAHAC
ncbi:MAG: hypothetical protein ACYCSF_13160 [Acidimicrobiales bacterium]